MTFLVAIILACSVAVLLCVYIGGAVSRYDQPDSTASSQRRPADLESLGQRRSVVTASSAYDRFQWARPDWAARQHVAGLYAGPWTAVPVMGQVRELVAAA